LGIFERTPSVGRDLHGKAAIVIMSEGMKSEPGLAQLIDALDALGAGFSLGQSWQKQCRQNPNDRDDTEQFN